MEELESTETEQDDQYLLTADDAELLQEILKHNLSHQSGEKRKFRFQDLKFTRQLSTFQNLGTTAPQFHGFFVLFWMGVTLMLFRLAANNWRTYGSIWGKNEIIRLMMDKDVIVLGLTDLLLCWSTGFCLILQRVVLKGYIRWNGLGWLIQNIWQTTYLGVVIWWAYHRDWPWTHTVFIVLHCLAMLMKQHSYAAYNGYLSEMYRKRNMLKASLSQTRVKERRHPTSAKMGYSSAVDTELNSEIMDLKKKDFSRRSSELQNYSRSHETDQLLSLIGTIETGVPLEPSQVKSLRELLEQEIEVLSEGLKGRCSLTNNHYPQNLTIGNICDFMALPTLVYELEYPRTKKIDWLYVAEKTLATFGIIVVMIAVSQSWIYPVVMDTVRMKEEGMTAQQRLREFPWVLGDLLFPFMMEYLLAFYVIWECVLNAVAEITMFADRGFYSDWWNSVSWDQFARDWNRPVHNFLFRHVYHGSISEYRLSRVSASLITFLLSACVHELLMLCIFRRLRGRQVSLTVVVEVYISHPERSTKRAILLLTDVIGHRFINAQLIADQLAANDYLVVMPDLFHGDPVPLNNRPASFDLMSWLKGPPGHLANRVEPVVQAILKEMKSNMGCERVGAVGYCFGAKYAVRLLRPGLCDVAYVAHPSFVDAEELQAIQGPLSIAAAETDSIFPAPKRHESEDILAKTGQPYQINLFSGVEHGFAVRADITKPTIRFAKESAFLQAVAWFDQYL
ncbi:Sterol O-acyltransferase [Penicillium freii]|nr:Sterol O-acyltransferase [Penicillium freii]